MHPPLCSVADRSSLTSLFPKGCTWFETDLVPACFDLHPREQAETTKMGAKRLKDFRASRYCARKALEQVNISGFPLLPSKDRAPVWPAEISGSITHKGDRCLAVISAKSKITSIGVDIEYNSPLKNTLTKQILTESEIQGTDHDSQDLILAKLIFSIKESIYKCLNPIYNQWIGFKDVTVKLNQSMNNFQVIAENSLHPSISLNAIQGSWLIEKDYIYSSCWLANSSQPLSHLKTQ